MSQFDNDKVYVFEDSDPKEEAVMTKYIGIDVPAYGCNLNCSYCYLDRNQERKIQFPKLNHSIKYIRNKLQKRNIGGSALIGICASGETLLADGIVELCVELLKEGHYIIIVTNATYSEGISKLIEAAGDYASHLMFKASFHYMELKKRNLLSKFADNITAIDQSKASFSIELMPHDELVEYIPAIMEYSYEFFGALPQLTIGRDEKNECKLLTKMSIEEYRKTWEVFKSEMFDLKMKYYMMHGTNCNAGRDSFFLEIDSGFMRRCLFADNLGNFYDDNTSLDFERVGDNCPLKYCYNCHAYVTIGVLPDYPSPSLAIIRDRERLDGRHWLKKDMRRFLDIKLYETK